MVHMVEKVAVDGEESLAAMVVTDEEAAAIKMAIPNFPMAILTAAIRTETEIRTVARAIRTATAMRTEDHHIVVVGGS